MQSKKIEKRVENEKVNNYQIILSQHYDKDPHLSDVKQIVKQITPQIDILNELTQFQKKIDLLLKNKRYDVQELYMKPPQRIKRLLRVQLTQTQINNQHVLKLFGYLYPPLQQFNKIKFTSFMKQIQFSYQNSRTVFQTWKKPTSGFIDKSGLLLKVPKITQQTISVSLFLINNPPKFKVDLQLSALIQMKSGTRIQILQAFWNYVKKNKLQDIENKEIIILDDPLKALFKNQKVTFASINNRIRQLILPVDPIKLILFPYENNKIYDIVVEIQEKPDADIVPFFSQKINEQKNDHPFLSMVSKIKKYQNKFKQHSEKLRRHLAKRQLYKNFNKQKIEQIIKQQHKLLKILKKADPIDEHNRLQFLLQNHEEVEKEIRHYFQQINTNLS